eukprot:gene49987-66952_t
MQRAWAPRAAALKARNASAQAQSESRSVARSRLRHRASLHRDLAGEEFTLADRLTILDRAALAGAER